MSGPVAFKQITVALAPSTNRVIYYVKAARLVLDGEMFTLSVRQPDGKLYRLSVRHCIFIKLN